jgi:WD40 repeat protein
MPVDDLDQRLKRLAVEAAAQAPEGRLDDVRRRRGRHLAGVAVKVALVPVLAVGIAVQTGALADKPATVDRLHPSPTVPAPRDWRAPTLLRTPAVVHAVAFSPDGRTLVSADGGRNLYLWDVARRVRTATVRNPTHSMFSVAFSRTGLLVTCGGGREISLWDIARKTRTAAMENPSGTAWAPAFSPDGTVVAVSHPAVGTTLWDTTRHTLIATLTTQGPNGARVAFSPDGTRLASVNGGHQISVWDVARHTRIDSMTTAAWAHDVAFAPDGRTLIVVEVFNGQSSRITMWDTTRRTRVATLPGTASLWPRIRLSSSGNLLAVRDTGSVRLWDLANRTLLAVLPATGTPDYDLSFSPDGQTLAATGKFEILVWHLPPRLAG